MTKFIRKKSEIENPDEQKIYTNKNRQKQSEQIFDLNQGNIFFMGMRASGKTTIASKLAKKLQKPFVDTDHKLQQDYGQNIAQIVANEGWDKFRELENKTLQQLCSQKGQIIATGGGIILNPENRKLMQESGRTFYLMAEIPLLLQRLKNSPNPKQRPALSELDLKEELVQTLQEREHLYMATANHILLAHKNVDDLIQDIVLAEPGLQS